MHRQNFFLKCCARTKTDKPLIDFDESRYNEKADRNLSLGRKGAFIVLEFFTFSLGVVVALS